MMTLLLTMLGVAVAQDPSPKLTAFVDTYYLYDVDAPDDGDRPPFLYHYTRHNEFTLNLGLIDVSMEGQRARGALGLQAGTFPQANQLGEPEMLRHVYQAFAGVSLADGLWIDVGVFPSHLGFESALSIDNITPSQSLVCENSPYYLSLIHISEPTRPS